MGIIVWTDSHSFQQAGENAAVDMQAVMNAIMYILCAGCAWRMLPNDFRALEDCVPLLSLLGVKMERGNEFMSDYACGYVYPVTENRHPLKQLWIAKQLKQPTLVSKEVGYNCKPLQLSVI